ncbi:hypothetical protein LIER_37730 [Lithospermum erythrorhizon]|uniref:Integrase catalytic domain-containing protein n=1 Tax=Lithospermum erythrorhizon TaxID=34254 RepID=A0AAV3PU63_LITER
MVTNNTLQEEYVAMVTKINMATAESESSWWLDSGATIHVFNNKEIFKTFKEVDPQEDFMMGNNVGAKVLRKGAVDLEFISEKKLSLLNVFYVPSFWKNLISTNLLCKNDFKIVPEFDKVVMTRNGVFVGKRYSIDRMFKLSICINAVNVVYSAMSLPLCHTRLGHINYDDYSRFTYVYLLRTKSEVFENFKDFKSIVENQKESKIKMLRSDRGGEYFLKEFDQFCDQHGIIYQTIAPYSPQQNRLAERKNKSLVEMVNTMLLNSVLEND